jgi:transcriptional regulator
MGSETSIMGTGLVDPIRTIRDPIGRAVALPDMVGSCGTTRRVGRPDEALHAFAPDRELLVIFAGPHGYISPSWYTPEMTQAPTWNFSTAHCYGHPQLLDAEENLAVLTRLVDHFERRVEHPVPLEPTFGARLARGTVGLRVPIERFVCKVKMSQDKDAVSQREVIAQLRGDGPYAHSALADDMERALGEG